MSTALHRIPNKLWRSIFNLCSRPTQNGIQNRPPPKKKLLFGKGIRREGRNSKIVKEKEDFI
jgi:hypothetical protein